VNSKTALFYVYINHWLEVLSNIQCGLHYIGQVELEKYRNGNWFSKWM